MGSSPNLDQRPETWWGAFDLDADRCGSWGLDSLQLSVVRLQREWRIGTSREREDGRLAGWHVDLNASMPAESMGLQRHAFSSTKGPLRVLPVCADRPVVTTPRIPLFLPPAQAVTLFVGSPLWVRLEVGEPPAMLAELPILRPSDTWFGPSTREGEICYATRTQAIVDVENIPASARSATTPVTIENQTPSTLPIERLKLPVPFLSVFASEEGELWTSSVTMVVQEGSEMASFDVKPGPPDDVVAELLTEPRARPEPGVLIRAFSLLQAFDRED